MSLANQIYDKAEKLGQVNNSKFFSVTDKKTVIVDGEPVEVVRPNGNHTVKVLREEIGKGKGYNGLEVDQLKLVILDNGQEKLWNIPTKNEDETLYFLIKQLKEIDYLGGEEFLVRAIKLKSGKYSKEIIRLEKGEEIPTINLDDEEESGDDDLGGAGTAKGEDDIPTEAIPF
jgi:hypothetical protein